MIPDVNLDQLREDITNALRAGHGRELSAIIYQEFEGRALGNPLDDGERFLVEGPPKPVCTNCETEADRGAVCQSCYDAMEEDRDEQMGGVNGLTKRVEVLTAQRDALRGIVEGAQDALGHRMIADEDYRE